MLDYFLSLFEHILDLDPKVFLLFLGIGIISLFLLGG